MSTEALLLALSAVIRPTSVAAVAAMLAARRPKCLLAAYLTAGLAFSLAVGIVVVVALAGIYQPGGSRVGRPMLDTVLGAAALAWAAATWIGWVPRASPAPDRAGWLRRWLQDLSPTSAAVAGVLTHLPGLIYLAALNAIASSADGALDGLVQVVIYNAIWFSVAITALVLAVHRPGFPEVVLAATAAWVADRKRVLVVVFCGVLGAYLVAVGVAGLTGAYTAS